MKSLIYIAACFTFILTQFSCNKIEDTDQFPPHYDCFGDTTPGFPFLESDFGTLRRDGEGVYYSGVFHDDATFEITYSGKCNVDTSSTYCKNDAGELISLDLKIAGVWEYHHTIDVVKVFREVCGLGCHTELDHSYTQLNGECIMTILDATIPDMEGQEIKGIYSLQCDTWSFLIHMPIQPFIGLFFKND